jgi:hypothetical protein
MPVPTRKSAALLFASSCLAAAGLMLGAGGCERDDERADRAVEESLSGDAREYGEAGFASLKKATQEPNASPAATAHAKSLLAQAEVEQAKRVLREVDADEIAVTRLASEIGAIAARVQANNAAIAGYQELAPKTTGSIAKLLLEGRDRVQGNGGSAVWQVGDGGTELPALSHTTEQSQKLTSEIADLEAKVKDLAGRRAAADKKAAALLRESRRTTGRKSVELFEQSTEQTKLAADVANQVGQVEHQLLRARQDLALAQAQSKQLETALTGYAAQIEQNAAAQQEIEALIEKHRALSNQLVYGDGAAPAGQTAGTPSAAAPAESDGNAAVPAAGGEAGGDTAEPGEDAPADVPADAPADAEAEGDAQPIAYQIEADAPPAAADADEAAPAEGQAPPVSDAPAEAEAAPAASQAPADDDVEGADEAAPAAAGQAPPDAGAAQGDGGAATPAAPVSFVASVTMADKAKELSTVADRAAARRGDAIALLTSAISNYDGAIADAKRLIESLDLRNQDIAGTPQLKARTWMAEGYSELKLNLQKANVQHVLAAAHRDAAATLAGRKLLAAVVKPILDEAGIPVPAGVDDPKVDAQFEEQRAAAEQMYKEADDLLASVIDGSGNSPTEQDAKRNAQISRVAAQYGRAQLLRIAGDAQKADGLIADARKTVNSGAPIAKEQYPLYLLIALGLVEAPALQTALPATAPSEAPAATQPAEAPATAPAEPEPTTAPAPEPEAPPEPAPTPQQAGPGGPGGMPGNVMPPGVGGPPSGGGMPPGMGGMPPGGMIPPGRGGPPPAGGGMPPGMGGMPPGGMPPGRGGPPAGGGMPPGMGGGGMPGGGMPPGRGGPPAGGGMPPGMGGGGMPGGGMPPGRGGPPAGGGQQQQPGGKNATVRPNHSHRPPKGTRSRACPWAASFSPAISPSTHLIEMSSRGSPQVCRPRLRDPLQSPGDSLGYWLPPGGCEARRRGRREDPPDATTMGRR